MIHYSLHSPHFSFSLSPSSQRLFLTHIMQLNATHRNYAMHSTQLSQLNATHKLTQKSATHATYAAHITT